MRDPRRDLVWVIAIVALGLRLGFVLTSPARALYWDERFYQSVATGYLGALGDAAEPTLADAIRAALYKGELYSMTVALTYSLFGAQPRAVAGPARPGRAIRR